MAGVKGKSGGPRKNAGGARPGAGRPPKEKPVPVPVADRDMLQLLQEIALGLIDATPIQVRAAVAAIQYTHPKVGEGGKKEQKQDEAKKVAGRFAPAAAPRLVAADGKRV